MELEASRVKRSFNLVAYELVFGVFPYYHLYHPKFYISSKIDEEYHVKEACLRQLQIAVESIEIVKNTHSIDTAQNRLDLARNISNQLSEVEFIFNGDIFRSISNKLFEEIKNAHTCVYKNVFNFNLEKSQKSKRQVTVEKYLRLAIDAVDQGLNDRYANADELKPLLQLVTKNKSD